MLRAAAPHGLRTQKAQRHEFEEMFANALTDILNRVRANGHAAALAANGKAAEVTAERARVDETLSAAQTEANARSKEREHANVVVKEGAAAVAEAKQTLTAKMTDQAQLSDKHAAEKERLVEHTRLLEDTWKSLKDGLVGGAQWKARDQKVNAVLRALQDVDEGLDDSLKDTLPVCLKAKPDGRGVFAMKAVEFAEELLLAQQGLLQQKIDGHEGEVGACSVIVDEAKSFLLSAETIHDNQMSELVAAEDALSAANDMAQQAGKASQSLKPTEKDLADSLSKATADLESIDGLLARFDGLQALSEH
jgi:hypothetical protein